jgi:C-terminal processing protease CtpA/Prc
VNKVENFLNEYDDGRVVVLSFRKKNAADLTHVKIKLKRKEAQAVNQKAGVGLIFKSDLNDIIRVSSVVPDGPAARTGQVHVNDAVLEVDGKNVFRKPLVQWKHLVVGPFGSLVTFRLQNEGSKDTHYVQMRRELKEIKDPEVSSPRAARSPPASRRYNKGGVGASSVDKVGGWSGNSKKEAKLPSTVPVDASKKSTIGAHFIQDRETAKVRQL